MLLPVGDKVSGSVGVSVGERELVRTLVRVVERVRLRSPVGLPEPVSDLVTVGLSDMVADCDGDTLTSTALNVNSKVLVSVLDEMGVSEMVVVRCRDPVWVGRGA